MIQAVNFDEVKEKFLGKGKSRAKPVQHERMLQINCVQWYALQYPREMIFHIPNGINIKSQATRGMYKRAGLTSGVPDLMIPVARKGYHGFFAELKSKRGKKPEPEQVRWIEYLRAKGYKVLVIYSLEDFMREVVSYMQ